MTPEPVRGKIRVVVGDARRLIAEALAALIGTMSGFAVTAVLSCGAAMAAAAAQKADLMLVGVGPERRKAVEFVRTVRALGPRPEVVIVADSAEPDLLKLVLEQRLGGLLMTDVTAAGFAACLDQVAHGHAVLPAGWKGVLAHGHNDPIAGLSERQMQVLQLLAEGCSYDQIAAKLFISVNTVKFHVRSISRSWVSATVWRRRDCSRSAVSVHPMRSHP